MNVLSVKHSTHSNVPQCNSHYKVTQGLRCARHFSKCFTKINSCCVTLSKVRQRRRNILCHRLYVESKEKWYKCTHLRKRLTDSRNEPMVAGGQGRGKDGGKGSLGGSAGTDMSMLLYYGQPTRSCLTARGTLLTVMRLPGREGGVGEMGRVCMYHGGVPSLFTWNRPSVVC